MNPRALQLVALLANRGPAPKPPRPRPAMGDLGAHRDVHPLQVGPPFSPGGDQVGDGSVDPVPAPQHPPGGWPDPPWVASQQAESLRRAELAYALMMLRHQKLPPPVYMPTAAPGGLLQRTYG